MKDNPKIPHSFERKTTFLDHLKSKGITIPMNTFKCQCDSLSTGTCHCDTLNEGLETYIARLSDDPTSTYGRRYTGKSGTEKDIALEYIEWCWMNRDGWEWMPSKTGDIKIIIQSAIAGKTTIFDYDIESEPCFYVEEIK